jgi:hypothetical protein
MVVIERGLPYIKYEEVYIKYEKVYIKYERHKKLSYYNGVSWG